MKYALVHSVCASAVFIKTSQTEVTSGDWVHVSFGDVDEVSREGCWIGLVSPADADVSTLDPTKFPAPDYPSEFNHNEMPWTATAPVKWITCLDADPAFNVTGQGDHDFRMINRRHDARFHLFVNGTMYPVARAASDPIKFKDIEQPHHVHLALTKQQGEMLVSWTSRSPDQALLQWGSVPGDYTQSVPAWTSSFAPDDLCGQPANGHGWFDPGFFHHATITGLAHRQKVHYRVGSQQLGWSQDRTFVNVPEVGADQHTRLIIAADVGATEPDDCHTHWSDPLNPEGQERQANLTHLRMQQAKHADVVLHVGDLAYATGYLAKWDLFMHQVEDLASTTPFMIGSGNHERDFPGSNSNGGSDSGGECGVPTEAHFRMPATKQDDSWYSFDVGAVHVVMMDTERSCASTESQFQFMSSDLENVNRSLTPWVIVNGHRPMYTCDGNHTPGPDLTDNFCMHGEEVEGLLVKHRVDLALWGHVHNVLVTCPVINGTCVNARDGEYAGPVHAVIGHGGQNDTPLPSPEYRPSWADFLANAFGYADVTANRTHLTLRIFENLPESVLVERTLVRVA